jgi:hypothetical protein
MLLLKEHYNLAFEFLYAGPKHGQLMVVFIVITLGRGDVSLYIRRMRSRRAIIFGRNGRYSSS